MLSEIPGSKKSAETIRALVAQAGNSNAAALFDPAVNAGFRRCLREFGADAKQSRHRYVLGRQCSARAARGGRAVADIPLDHFDGLDTFEDLPSDGRCVRDMWF